VSRRQRLLIGGATAILLAAALGGPASAADTKGTLAIINGVPGKRLDVCVNGVEIASGLRYGKVVTRNTIGTGEKLLRFFGPDPRTCKGKRFADRDIVLHAADDVTVVVTRKVPKVVVFDNVGLGEIPPAGPPAGVGAIVFRSASDVVTNFFTRVWLPNPETPVDPSAYPLATKGESYTSLSGDFVWRLRVTEPESPTTIASRTSATKLEHRPEWYLVGSTPANMRIVVLDRAISSASP
jgi:hypothetical protein